MDDLEVSDIQGLLRHGYPFLPEAAYYLLAIDRAAAAKVSLGRLLDEGWIVDAAAQRGWLRRRVRHAAAVAFTASGLRKLGISHEDMRTFVPEFQEGMAAAHRARLLGDLGTNCPESWRWGGANPVDALVIVYARRRNIDAGMRIFEGMTRGFRPVVPVVRGSLQATEPFGFMDGISQPGVGGLTRERAPAAQNEVPPGEFVLGYRNAFDRFPASPSLGAANPAELLPLLGPAGRADFGRNGSFVVLRQLEQNVADFDAFLRGAAAALAASPDAPSRDPAELREWLAAKMVGRWRSGAPLVRYPNDVPTPRTIADFESENDFGFHREDRHGLICPIGAHIRRANPRDAFADAMDVSPGEARRRANEHRLLRRGRVYRNGNTQGLMFLCLNANIERQFEFVQGSWVMHPEFGGLRGERDPLLAGSDGQPHHFTLQMPMLGRCVAGLRQFVTVRGGEYFFLPGFRALRYLVNCPVGLAI